MKTVSLFIDQSNPQAMPYILFRTACLLMSLVLFGACSNKFQSKSIISADSTLASTTANPLQLLRAADTITLNLFVPQNATYPASTWMTFAAQPTSSTQRQVNVSYSVNGVKLCDVIASPYANCSYQTPALPQNVKIDVVARDATGAVANATITMVISSGTPVPTPVQSTVSLNFNQPSNGSVMPSNQWMTLSSAATSSTGAPITLYYYVNDVQYCTVNSTPYSCSYLTPSASGNVTIRVVATDANGGSAQASSTFSVGSAPVAPPLRSGFTLKTAEDFTSIDPMKWMVQEANSPAAINLSSNPTDAFGEVEANLPNQYVMIPGGGVRIVSKKQSFSAIGGNANKQCADASVSNCSFPWTSSQFSGKGGLQSGYGYYEWATKLPAVPVGGLGTWPATWLLGGDTAPQYEEIDFMERFSTDPDHIDFHLHYGNGRGDFNNSNSIHFCDTADTTGHHWTDLHTFAVDWESTSITGYIDGVQCGVVHQGDAPNEYGSTPAIIPSGLMFPIFNTAIAPNVNAVTAANPVYFDVFHYWYYSSNLSPTTTPEAHLLGLQVDKGVYNPGDTVTVSYKIAAGNAPLSSVALSGVAVMDFLGDSASFQQGSTVNGVFGSWMYFTLANPINANSSYTGTFTYAIPSAMTPGLYTVYVGTLNANGVAYPGNYVRFSVGSGVLPPAP